jgi:hypothetical protein
MKLELKHLAPYLPHDIEVLDALNQKVKIIGLKNETYFIENGNTYAYGDIQDCKPILRPLSELTKEIEVNGEKFVPILYLIEVHGNSLDYSYLLSTKNVIEYSYAIVEKLLEWHFDIFGLIENNLAIDINTLNK